MDNFNEDKQAEGTIEASNSTRGKSINRIDNNIKNSSAIVHWSKMSTIGTFLIAIAIVVLMLVGWITNKKQNQIQNETTRGPLLGPIIMFQNELNTFLKNGTIPLNNPIKRLIKNDIGNINELLEQENPTIYMAWRYKNKPDQSKEIFLAEIQKTRNKLEMFPIKFYCDSPPSRYNKYSLELFQNDFKIEKPLKEETITGIQDKIDIQDGLGLGLGDGIKAFTSYEITPGQIKHINEVIQNCKSYHLKIEFPEFYK